MSCERQCSVAERVYRLMLLAYCAGFRERYGQQMIEAFRQGQRESCQTGGPKTPLPFWLVIVRGSAGNNWVPFHGLGATAIALCFGFIFLGGNDSTTRRCPNT